MTEVRQEDHFEDKSLGELVAMTTSNLSRLINSEIQLAKLELMDDAKRAGLGGALFGIAGFLFCMVLVLGSITVALVLRMWGVWDWAAFGIVTLAWLLLAGIAALIGMGRMKKITGIRRTRSTVRADLAALRRSNEPAKLPVE